MRPIIYLRKDRQDKVGKCPVYLRVIINRKKKEYYLSISVLPEHWDKVLSNIAKMQVR